MKRLAVYLSFVRFSHSVFALPFALAGALLAARQAPITWEKIAWILVAMVSARCAAMGFNRVADAPLDALNPRTAGREIPRGVVSPRQALVLTLRHRPVSISNAERPRTTLEARDSRSDGVAATAGD